MNQNQLSPTDTAVVSRPVLVKIIAIFFIIWAGLEAVLALSLPFFFPQFSSAENSGKAMLIGLIAILLGLSALFIFMGLALLKMKKWVIYAYSALFVIQFLAYIYDILANRGLNWAGLVILLIEALIFFYFWSIRKKFA